MDAVVAEQVGVGGGRSQVVDCHDLEVRAAAVNQRPQHIAPDAAEAVDRDLGAHLVFSSADLAQMASVLGSTVLLAGSPVNRRLGGTLTGGVSGGKPLCAST